MKEPAIDIPARRRTAEIYRHFATGRLSNYEMEDALPDSREWALHDIWFLGVWPLYDDMHRHKLTGDRRLPPEGREHIARIVLFLHTSLPYRWKRATGSRVLGRLALTILTLGVFLVAERLFRRGEPVRQESDENVWPFFTRREYEAALRNPLYLRG